MRHSFMAGSILFAFIVLFLSASQAEAELERYDLPGTTENRPGYRPFPSSLLPGKGKGSLTPVKQVNVGAVASKQAAVRPDAAKSKEKQRSAQLKTIAAIFQKSNRKLSAAQAADYAGFVIQASEKFGQNPLVIASVIINESTVRHDAVSKGGDYGLMQVRWRVHQKKITSRYPNIKTAKDILNPEFNVLIGTEIFSGCSGSSKDVRAALLRYSAGNNKLADKVCKVLNTLESSYRDCIQNL